MAIYGVGLKISETTGGDAWEAFKSIYGDLRFSMVESNGSGWSCEANGSGLTCFGAFNQVDLRVIAHELGHTFNANMENKGSASPYDVLAESTIVDANGNWVEGKNSVGVWQRTFSGYQSNRASDVYHGTRFDDWNSVGEDYADMYMNWVFNSFAANPAGIARYNWMETHMEIWLALAIP